MKARKVPGGITGVVAAAGAALAIALAPGGALPVAAQPAPPVVGGDATDTGTYPWVVTVASRATFGNARSGQFCGGTLIAPDKVLTAAHCMHEENGARADRSDLTVIQGRTDLRTDTGREVKVTRMVISPDFNFSIVDRDWAVLTLAEKLDVQPLPMVRQGEEAYGTNQKGLVLGWGDTTGGGTYSPLLRKVSVPLLSDAACRQAFPGGAYGTFVAADMVCAGEWEGGRDACGADSGGPLVIRGRLAGLVSWGDGCAQAHKPGVYTRLAAFSDVIRRAAGL